MSTTTTLTANMAELKSEPGAHGGSLWSNYHSSVPLSSRFPNPMDSGLPHGSSQHRPRSSVPGIDTQYSSYPHYGQEEADSFARNSAAHYGSGGASAGSNGYGGTKRAYPEHAPYQEMVQDLRDDSSKVTVNHDHKLLSFRQVHDKHTIVDQQGRVVQSLSLSAQLHGMFFLSEMPSHSNAAAGEGGGMVQPELTCYRRNLFQVSGQLMTPRGQLSVLQQTGENADMATPVPVSSTEVTISAIESVDGHPVRLIVIPWKTPPPNSPELPQTADQEPPSLPLIPFPDDGHEAEGEFAVYPIGWRRLQFRIATANNGRRKELQQHFVLHLKVMGTLANGNKVVLTESTTAPIVVRGRSPRNFQARKEIPLLGSSAGSRGQALVETGLGVVAGPLSGKLQDHKLRGLNEPPPVRRTDFTFSAGPHAPKMPESPSAMGAMRSSTYPAWGSGPSGLPQMPASATGSYPPSSMAAEYQKMPLSATGNFTAEPQEMSMPSVQMPLSSNDQPQHSQASNIRTQYAYAPSTPTTTDHHQAGLHVPRYVDQGPRPSKSPRHGSHPSTSSMANDSEYRYGPYSAAATEQPPSATYSSTGPAPETAAATAPPVASSHTPTQLPPPTQVQGHRDYYTAPSASSWASTTPTAASAAESNGSLSSSYHHHNGTSATGADVGRSSSSSYLPGPPLPTSKNSVESPSQSHLHHAPGHPAASGTPSGHHSSSHPHHHQHQPPAPSAAGGYQSGMNHYSWSSN